MVCTIVQENIAICRFQFRNHCQHPTRTLYRAMCVTLFCFILLFLFFCVFVVLSFYDAMWLNISGLRTFNKLSCAIYLFHDEYAKLL